jgi:hypothetical protein
MMGRADTELNLIWNYTMFVLATYNCINILKLKKLGCNNVLILLEWNGTVDNI